jgi:archaellum component FlaC
MVELYKQEMAEMKKSTDALGLKIDRVSEIVTEIMNDYGQVKQAIKEWEKCCLRTEEKLRHLDEERRKNNIIIFGLQ